MPKDDFMNNRHILSPLPSRKKKPCYSGPEVSSEGDLFQKFILSLVPRGAGMAPASGVIPSDT